jgi:hypothetical protein
MTLTRTRMPLSLTRGKASVAASHSTFDDLMRKLDEGWQIEAPVYVMADLTQRNRIVFRMVIWRAGRPQVATVHDGPEMRQFLADRRLRQEAL